MDVAKDYFGLAALQETSEGGGSLILNAGDALDELANVEGGFAGTSLFTFTHMHI